MMTVLMTSEVDAPAAVAPVDPNLYEGRWSADDSLVHLFRLVDLFDPRKFQFRPLHNEAQQLQLLHHASDLSDREPLSDSVRWCTECAQVVYDRMGTPPHVRMLT